MGRFIKVTSSNNNEVYWLNVNGISFVARGPQGARIGFFTSALDVKSTVGLDINYSLPLYTKETVEEVMTMIQGELNVQ